MEPQGPWYKMFHEWSHDLKVQTLSEADQRRHVMMMCLHARGEEPSVERYAVAMRITVAELRETVARLRASGLKVGEDCSLPSWKRRQGPSPAQRKRKERQEHKRRHTDVARLSHDCRKIVADVSHVDLDLDRDAEERREDHPLPPQGVLFPSPEQGATEERLSGAKHKPSQAEEDAAVVAELDRQADERTAKEEPIPYEDIVAAYHQALPSLPKCRAHGHDSAVRKNIRARWDACAERHSMDWWRAYFAEVADIPFLMGEVYDENGDPKFKANLSWLVLPTNMDKVLNGHYQKRPKALAEVKPDCKWCLCAPCVCRVEYDDKGNVIGEKVHADH